MKILLAAGGIVTQRKTPASFGSFGSLTQLIAGNSVSKDVRRHARSISALLLPIFLIGQAVCFCASMRAAAHTKMDEAVHACCANETRDPDHGKTPGDKNQRDCDHCRGAQSSIAPKAADQSQALKLLTRIWSPFIQATATISPGIELPAIPESFTLDRPPPDLFVWHCALLN